MTIPNDILSQNIPQIIVYEVTIRILGNAFVLLAISFFPPNNWFPNFLTSRRPFLHQNYKMKRSSSSFKRKRTYILLSSIV